MLDRMGNGMDATRGIMSGTMDRFKKVFEKKSNRKIMGMDLGVGSFVLMNAVTSRQARNIKSSMYMWGNMESTGIWSSTFWHYFLTRMNYVLGILILCVFVCVYVFLCIKLHIESMFMY
ncbi:uncharacterized protein [Gossypium hirsutum]|uniref:Uncharacterized protein isoform X3 n=1 Tax=Gossypium hirsutum TaxID=3635 RepID=A0ABM3BM04_GOSHI|nr:uncharacterized protein LOC107916698 isoform X3 [Gossypium hirsutum]